MTDFELHPPDRIKTCYRSGPDYVKVFWLDDEDQTHSPHRHHPARLDINKTRMSFHWRIHGNRPSFFGPNIAHLEQNERVYHWYHRELKASIGEGPSKMTMGRSGGSWLGDCVKQQWIKGIQFCGDVVGVDSLSGWFEAILPRFGEIAVVEPFVDVTFRDLLDERFLGVRNRPGHV